MQAEKEGTQFAEPTAKDVKYAVWHEREVAKSAMRDSKQADHIRSSIQQM